MAALFISGDTHFGHQEAISLFARPFDTTEAMDSALVARINERVGRRDTLIHIGDFCGPAAWSKRSVRRRASEVRAEIRCRRIILVRGNHDPQGVKAFDRLFEEVTDLLSIRLRDGSRGRLNLCHYPLRVWRGQFKGAMLGYGHTHGTVAELDRSTDVGVDCWDFSPIEVTELANFLRTREVRVPQAWPRIQPTRSPLDPMS
ncbi:MAG: metallophosphoesterase [Phycisphaeraceae bacterium]|nr:metallophosphoesterase [Phycisphaeraceae bacterium]